MVPRDGLQESRFIKGLARGGTLKPLPVFFSFPYYGVPPIREEFRALPDDKRMRVARVLEVDALARTPFAVGIGASWCQARQSGSSRFQART